MAVISEVDHSTLAMPITSRSVDTPWQTCDAVGMMATVGRGLTVIWMLAVLIQPLPSVPVTVYVVVVVGATVIIRPVSVVLHIYVEAPLA